MAQCKICLDIIKYGLIDRIFIIDGHQIFINDACFECIQLFNYLFQLRKEDIDKKNKLGFNYF